VGRGGGALGGAAVTSVSDRCNLLTEADMVFDGTWQALSLPSWLQAYIHCARRVAIKPYSFVCTMWYTCTYSCCKAENLCSTPCSVFWLVWPFGD